MVDCDRWRVAFRMAPFVVLVVLVLVLVVIWLVVVCWLLLFAWTSVHKSDRKSVGTYPSE